MITAVDTNILVDILEPDPRFGPGSKDMLKHCIREGAIVACEVVWAEVLSVYASDLDKVRAALESIELSYSPMTEEASWSAARLWHEYREQGGGRDRIVADFLVGAHALVQSDRLLTRDRGFYRSYFLDLHVVTPASAPE